MPSTEEAFGVAYIEAMAAGIPAIGATGEPGPAEIAAVRRRDRARRRRATRTRSPRRIARLLADPDAHRRARRRRPRTPSRPNSPGRPAAADARGLPRRDRRGRFAQARVVHREQPLGGGGSDRADAPPDEPLGRAPDAVGGRPSKERVHRPPERIDELAGHPQAGVPGDGRDRWRVKTAGCDRRASATGRLLARRAETLSSSGTSTITRAATRAASASTATGSGTCSSTCESTASSNAPAS